MLLHRRLGHDELGGDRSYRSGLGKDLAVERRPAERDQDVALTPGQLDHVGAHRAMLGPYHTVRQRGDASAGLVP